MNTKGTPAYKRVARAEASRDEWKMKAIERREVMKGAVKGAVPA